MPGVGEAQCAPERHCGEERCKRSWTEAPNVWRDGGTFIACMCQCAACVAHDTFYVQQPKSFKWPSVRW